MIALSVCLYSERATTELYDMSQQDGTRSGNLTVVFSVWTSSQIVRTFSFKGMTNKLFGQEAPEQREARLKLLEELIAEGEETVKDKTAECE